MAFENLNLSALAKAAENQAQSIKDVANIKAQAKLNKNKQQLGLVKAVGGFLFGGPAVAALEGTSLGGFLQDSILGNAMGIETSEARAKREEDEALERDFKRAMIGRFYGGF